MNSATGERNVVRITRTIPAPPREVYRAWLDPELIRRWMAPGTYEIAEIDVDERIGGRYRIRHASGGAPVGGFECEILELLPDQRIVWRWGFAGPEGTAGPVYDSELRVTLHETPDGDTLLELVHARLGDLAAALPKVADKVEAGWDGVLAKLGFALSSAPRSSIASGAPNEMPKPAFTQTMQIGIVVRNLDTAMRKYVDDYGIGPWEVFQIKPGEVKEWREHGRPAKPSTRCAVTMVGSVQWELIEPLDDTSIFAMFLAEKGGGVHHVAVAAANYDETLTQEAQRGNDLVLDCELDGQFRGIKVAYLGTEPDLGVTLEVFNKAPEGV